MTAADVEKIRLTTELQRPIKVIVKVENDNARFVAGFIRTVDRINHSDKLTDGAQRREEFKVHLEGNKYNVAELEKILDKRLLKERCEVHIDDQANMYEDRWMRDWGALGSVKLRNEAKEHILVFDSNRGRGTTSIAPNLAKRWNGIVLTNPATGRSCGDYGGNILPTPDGPLVLGNTSSSELRNLFATTGYKDRLAIVDTKWLRVGHVDEYLSIVPDSQSRTGHAYVKADPRLALRLIRKASLKELKSISNPSYREQVVKVHKYLKPRARQAGKDPLREKIVRYLGSLNRQGNPTRTGKRLYQEIMAAAAANWRTGDTRQFVLENLRIGQVIDQGLTEIGRVAARSGKGASLHAQIAYPQLYEASSYSSKESGHADAFFPDTVNQLVLRNHTITPDPHIDLFRRYIRKTNWEHGVTTHFLDDEETYHKKNGDIHCGTNVLRHPDQATSSHERLLWERR